MKLSVHPLFFAFGIYFALTGKVFLFLTFAFTALAHEYGHALRAETLGYKINKITLMPYGAVVNGAIEGLSFKDEIAVALSGPLVNLCVCVFFVSLWWLIPETYAYTDSVVFSNLSVAAVNLLPAYPLDGGRIFTAFLAPKISYKKAVILTRAAGVLIAAACAALFVWSIVISALNLSLAFFSGFLLVGALSKSNESRYVRIFKNRFSKSVEGIKEVKKLVASSKLTLKRLLACVAEGCFYELEIRYDKGGETLSLTRSETEELLSGYRLYDEIGVIAREIKSDENSR